MTPFALPQSFEFVDKPQDFFNFPLVTTLRPVRPVCEEVSLDAS